MFTHDDLRTLLHERIDQLADADEIRPLVDDVLDSHAKLAERGYTLLGDPDVFLLVTARPQSTAAN